MFLKLYFLHIASLLVITSPAITLVSHLVFVCLHGVYCRFQHFFQLCCDGQYTYHGFPGFHIHQSFNKERPQSYSSIFLRFEINTTSDWLNHFVVVTEDQCLYSPTILKNNLCLFPGDFGNLNVTQLLIG